MRTTFLKYGVVLFFLIPLAWGCKKHRIIPDKQLKEIMEEVYISNAYYSNILHNRPDSVDLYGPILKKYGYTSRDFLYSLESFSRRKSTRISDLVDDVTERLRQQNEFYQNRIAMADSTVQRSRRLFSRTVYFTDSIVASKISDTALLRIVVPVEPGTYQVTYTYELDTLDKNKSLRNTFHLRDSAGKNTSFNSNWMTSGKRQRMDNIKPDAKEGDVDLQIIFGNYQKNMTAPRLRIDSLNIVWLPSVEAAADSVRREFIIPPFLYDILNPPVHEEDSSALYLYPGGF